MAGKIYLGGAGPGDPELITQRGLRRLGEADLVLFDALIHPELLSHCRPDAEIVFVGKRAGRVQARQEEIQRRMLDAARAGRTVARAWRIDSLGSQRPSASSKSKHPQRPWERSFQSQKNALATPMIR